MTQDEIIELARQAGINYRELSDEFATGNGDGVEVEQMEAFAKMVAAKERDSCAKLCDNQAEYEWALGGSGEGNTAAKKCASAIRARGQE